MRISDWSSDVCSSDLLGGAPDDGAVDHHQPLARQVLLQRVQLHAHGRGAGLLRGGDEAAADVAVLDQAGAGGDAGAAGEAPGGGDAGRGNRTEERRGGKGWVRPW